MAKKPVDPIRAWAARKVKPKTPEQIAADKKLVVDFNRMIMEDLRKPLLPGGPSTLDLINKLDNIK